MARFPAFQYKHVKHCSTHPKFLHSNSTSHRWAFGAIAELIDNAIDPDVNASQFCIDLREFNGEPCLVLMDNGCGLTPERLHKMLSFGHSKKQMTPGDRSIGKHGNGFKSGTMRLGRDVLVLTKCVVSMTAGFLSQTFLADVGAEDILIPLISWDLKGNRLSPRHADIEESLQAICNYSIFPDEASILAQLDAIPGTGTILIISNLRRHEGVLELDYKTDPHDIRITSEITSSHYQQIRPNQPNSTDVPTDYSLRAYVAILYKVPRMQIFIRDHKVRTKRIAGLLSQKEVETYKPMGVSETTKIELGFNSDNRNLYGMMLYHRNRLIKPYMRVGMQLEENEKGMGVLGVVEADFLQPTHNKQDFDDTTAYRRLLKKLADVLNEYWWEKKERLSLLSPQADFSNRRHSPNNISEEDIPDVIWVQCDNPSCLKWRILPDGTDPTSLPDTWYCEYHPDSKYRRHEEPEQEWDASVPHEIVERRKERKREYDRERKEREAQRRRQKLEALAKEDQKQKEAIRKEMEEKAALEQLRFEKERKEHEEQVQRLQKEVAEAQAFRDEMTRKHEELLKQLHGREEAAATKEFSSFPTMEENVVQVSEHEYSQTGSGEFSEETREVSASKTTSKMLIDSGRRDEISTLSKNQNETSNRAHLEIIVDDSPLCSQRDRSLQEDMMVCSSSAARSQEQGLHRQFDLEILQPTTMASLPLNSDRHSKDLMSSSHFGKVFNESQLPSSSPAVITSFLPSAGSGARGNSSETTYQSHSEMQKWPRPGRYPPAANNSYGMAQTTTSMSKGADVVGAAPTMPETPSPSCMPAFLTQYSRSAAAPQSSANTFTHHLLETSTNTNQGPTSVSLAGFQDSSLPPSELFEQGPMLMDNDEEDHRRPNQFAIIPTSNRNDIQRRVMSNASISGRINDPPNTNLATSILATQMPLECVGANGNSFGCETDLAPNKEVFSLQRRLRVALNTLLRIGGTMEANLMNFELPSTDMDVVTICEKTKNAVEMRWRTYEEEIAKLRAELAYTFSGNYRMGRSITDNWGAAIGIQK